MLVGFVRLVHPILGVLGNTETYTLKKSRKWVDAKIRMTNVLNRRVLKWDAQSSGP